MRLVRDLVPAGRAVGVAEQVLRVPAEAVLGAERGRVPGAAAVGAPGRGGLVPGGDRLRQGAEPAPEPGLELGAVRQSGERVVAGPVGELELVPLAVLDVLDVGEQEARALGGVGHDRVPQTDPLVPAVAAGEP